MYWQFSSLNKISGKSMQSLTWISMIILRFGSRHDATSWSMRSMVSPDRWNAFNFNTSVVSDRRRLARAIYQSIRANWFGIFLVHLMTTSIFAAYRGWRESANLHSIDLAWDALHADCGSDKWPPSSDCPAINFRRRRCLHRLTQADQKDEIEEDRNWSNRCLRYHHQHIVATFL